jgi:hypothetical protein
MLHWMQHSLPKPTDENRRLHLSPFGYEFNGDVSAFDNKTSQL